MMFNVEGTLKDAILQAAIDHTKGKSWDVTGYVVAELELADCRDAQAHLVITCEESDFLEGEPGIPLITITEEQQAITVREHVPVNPNDAGHELIGKERLSHLDRGYDLNHDLQYHKDELVQIAVLLAAEDTELEPFVKGLNWPIAGYPDRRGKLDKIRRLTMAGAFLAAAIDLEIAKSKQPVEAVTNAL